MGEIIQENAFKIVKSSNYIVLRFVGEINDLQAEAYIKEQLPQIVVAELDLIVNCSCLTKLSEAWISALESTDQAIRKISKRMRLIMIPEQIQKMLKIRGLSQTLKNNTDLRGALLELGLLNKRTFDVGFINPFLQATVSVLSVLTKFNAIPGTVFIKKDSNDLSGDISGVMSILSESFRGNIIISFPEKTFLTIMSKVHNEPYNSLNNEIADGAAEIVNMIFGAAKIILNEVGYGIKTVLPSVVVGKAHSVSLGDQVPIFVVPFGSEGGAFYVEFTLADDERVA